MSQQKPTLDQLYKDYNMATHHQHTIFDMLCKEIQNLQQQVIELTARNTELSQPKKSVKKK